MSYKILANVEISDEDASGVVFESSRALEPGTYTLGMEFTKESAGEFAGGEIQFVGVTIEGAACIDLEAEAMRVMFSQ